MADQHPISTGHVKLGQRKRGGPAFYAKYRPAGAKQTTRLIGPAWLKRGRPPAGYFTEAMAEVELHRMLEEADRGEGVAAADHTFGEACAEWLRYIEHEKGVAERTLGTDRGAVDARLIPFFGADTPIADIATEAIDRFRAHSLIEGGRHGRPLKPSTVSRDMTNLSAIFKRAVRLKWVDTNPYLDAEKIPQKRTRSKRYNALTVAEVEKVATAAGEQMASLIRVAAFTGARFGELRALRWRDVEFANANLQVCANLPVHGTVEKDTKSEEPRSVPLLRQAADALRDVQIDRRGVLTRPDDLVFIGATGDVLDYETTKDAFYAALVAAGLAHLRKKDRKPKPFTFHDLRHTFGTMMAEAGESLVDIQYWMGHADIKTTMIYAHARPKADVAERISARIAAQLETVSPASPEPVHSGDAERNSAQLDPA